MRPQPHSQTGSRVKIAAALTDSGAVHDVVAELAASTDPNETLILLSKETELLLQTFTEVTLEHPDIIGNEKTISSLCLLHSSMQWLASRITNLKHISTQVTDSSKRDSNTRITTNRRWTMVATASHESPSDRIYLPLSRDTAPEFDAVVTSYTSLAQTVLRMLHVDLRSQIALDTRQALSRTFDVEQPFTEPDPEILSLNADITTYDEAYAIHLDMQEQKLLTHGLAHFIDHLLVLLTQTLTIMNNNGCGRLQLDILVLQQNLKNVEADANLAKSALYLDLFAAGPDAIITQAKEQGKPGDQHNKRASSVDGDIQFSRKELEKLLELVYSVALKSERREVAVQAKRGLDDHILQLSEHIW